MCSIENPDDIENILKLVPNYTSTTKPKNLFISKIIANSENGIKN